MKWESNPDFGNYRSETCDSIVEKQIFENLISRDPYLVLERIKTSPEPWWGISHLSASEIADDVQVHEVIKSTAESIATGISSSDVYWEILQKIKYYSWLFDNEFIVKVISEKIRTSNSPVLLQQVQPYFDRLIEHDAIRGALLHFLETSDYPQAVFELVENHPSFYTEEDTIDTIESVIKTSDAPWHLIKTALGFRQLAENESIRSAIKSRFPDIITATKKFETIWTPVESICSDSSFLNESTIIDALVESLNHPEISKNIINLICSYYEITSKPEIQQAIGDILSSITFADLMNILVPIHDLPHVMQSDPVKSALKSRLDDFVRLYSETDLSLNYVGLVSQVPILMNHEPILSELYDLIPEIVKSLENGYSMYELIPLYIHSSCFEKLLSDPRWKKGIVERFKVGYGYILLVSSFEHMSWIINESGVVESIAKMIRTHNDVFEPVYFLLKVPQFLEMPLTLEAVKQRLFDIYSVVRSAECSVNDLETLSKVPFFSERQEYVDAVLEFMTNFDHPWLVAEVVQDDDRIRNAPLFKKTIMDNLPSLVDMLTSKSYQSPMKSLHHIPNILKIKSIRSALDILAGNLTEWISTNHACWFPINDASACPSLSEHPELMNAIMGRVDDLAFAIKRRRDNFEVISQISWCEELITSQKIIDAILYAILHHNEPWEICDIECPENLFKNEAIRKAVLDRASDIAYLIEYNREGKTITDIIERFNFLASHEEITSAIRSLRSHKKS